MSINYLRKYYKSSLGLSYSAASFDGPEILEWLKSQENDPHVLTWLGKLASQSWTGHPADLAAAESYYLQAVAHGNPTTHLGLSHLYARVDAEKAKASYLLLPDNHNPFLKVIDYCYQKPGAGDSLDEDVEASFLPLLQAEIEKGNPKARVIQFCSTPENGEDYPVVHEWLTSQEDDHVPLIWLGIFEDMMWPGHPDNFETAEEYYSQAISKGGLPAIKAIAQYYSFTEIEEVTEEYTIMRSHIGSAAQPSFIEKAEKYYVLAAERGDKSAHRKIAQMYHWGPEGQPIDMKKAVQHYKLASDNGCNKASFQLAQLHHYGPSGLNPSGHPIDIEKAEEFYLLAHEQGHPLALQTLIQMYRKGPDGHPINADKVEQYSLLASENGAGLDCQQLAQMYNWGPDDQPIDMEKAIKYYELDAEQGNVSSYQTLAQIHCWGQYGQPANLKEAERYYTLAIENGVSSATEGIASLYQSAAQRHHYNLNDQGYDLAKAVKYYTLAIQHGDTSSYNLLAALYHFGCDGQGIDLEEAEKYYKLTVEHGNKEALFGFATLLKSNNETLGEAATYYRQYVKNEGSNAYYACTNMASFYNGYNSVWQDQPHASTTALYWLLKSLQFEGISFGDTQQQIRTLLFPTQLNNIPDQNPQGMRAHIAVKKVREHMLFFLQLKNLIAIDETKEKAPLQKIEAFPEVSRLAQKMLLKSENSGEKQEHYKCFGNKLSETPLVFEKVLNSNSLSCMSPGVNLSGHLLTRFNFYPITSEEVGLRLYDLNGKTYLAFGEPAVMEFDSLIRPLSHVLDGQYSLNSLIAYYQEKIDQLTTSKDQLTQEDDDKIVKNQEKIRGLQEIIDRFEQDLAESQPKRLTRFKFEYPFLEDLFDKVQ